MTKSFELFYLGMSMAFVLGIPYIMSYFYWYYTDSTDKSYYSIKMRPHEDYVTEREARLEEEKHAA